MKVKLNIQAIRVAERLLKKPFGKFDLSDEETITALLYGMVSENNEEVHTLESFKKILGMRKIGSEISAKLQQELAYMNQFQEESEVGGDDVSIGDLAASLISSGMNERFVLYEMKLFEISDYVKALDDKKKEKMEDDRFWTYLSILPHVDGKKLKTPRDLITFPWEEERNKIDREAEIKRGEEIFEKFFNSKRP